MSDDSTIVAALEAAIEETGGLLAQLERYHAGGTPDGLTMRRDVLTLGDRARYAHHTGSLGAGIAAALLAEAQGLSLRLQAILANLHRTPPYPSAVSAHDRGDLQTLAATLPHIFAGLAPLERPPDLYHSVVWYRRNRPLPPDTLAGDLAALATIGLPAQGDGLAPGCDPALPAVTLATAPLPGDALCLRFAAADLPRPACRLVDTGDVLFHVRCLRAPFAVLIPQTLDDDVLEATPVDWPRYRVALIAALAARALRVADP